MAFLKCQLRIQKDTWAFEVQISTPVVELILHTVNVELFDYNTEAWVGEALSKGMKIHKNVRCFNCGGIGHLRSNCRQAIPLVMTK